MPKLTETGFQSLAQENYLRINEPELYKFILKKFGSFGKKKKPTDRSFMNKMKNGVRGIR